MKLYQKIEQIFKFRLLSSSDISSYMRRMSGMGKIDAVKTEQLLTLILVSIAQIEEKLERLEQQSQHKQEMMIQIDDIGFPCTECDFVAKSKLGLQSHLRSHKK